MSNFMKTMMMSKEFTPLEERLHSSSYVLSNKEIDELRTLCFEHSNSWCPLATFFNDILLNESETYNKNEAYKDLWLIALIVLNKKKELKALEAIKQEFLDRGDFIFRLEYGSDAMLVIEQWIKDIKISEIKIPFDRNYYDLLKEVLL